MKIAVYLSEVLYMIPMKKVKKKKEKNNNNRSVIALKQRQSNQN